MAKRKFQPVQLRNEEEQDSKIELIRSFSPKTKNQTEYVRSIVENTLTLCSAPAGAGKTAIAVAMACQYLARGDVNTIVITRPLVECGERMGALPGDVTEKVIQYMIPVIEELDYYLGKQQVKKLIEEGIIKISPLELMRGKNMHKCFMIGDEMQNASYSQIKMFLTRIGNNTKCVASGDIKQSDLNVCEFAEVITRLDNANDIGICKLGLEDIQRSDLVKTIITRLE